MAMESIEELFEHELKDILGGEQALVDALEQMAQESSDRDIKKAYTQHRKETQGQIKRIEKIFRLLGQKPEAEKRGSNTTSAPVSAACAKVLSALM